MDIGADHTDISDMNKVYDCDAIVVGGGLGGAASALGLAHAGLSVIALDADPGTATNAASFDGRAYAVALGSQRFWNAVGVWDRVADQSEPMIDVLVSDGRVSEGASPLFMHLDHRELAEGVYGYMIEDRHLRPALVDALGAAVDYRTGVRVASVEYETGRAIATLSDGTTLAAPLLVACDGGASPIAAAAGIRRVKWNYDQNGLVCAVGHELPHHGVAHEMFLPGGPFAILPLRGNRSSLVWTERTAEAQRIHALSDEGYVQELEKRFGDFLGDITLEGGRWTYPLRLSLAHEYVRPRLALTGDAAHAVHPIAGQGLNLGVRDAAALAEVIGDALRVGEDIGALDVLERYQRWRRFDSTALALSMDALNRVFSNDFTPLRALRDLGLAAMNHLPGPRKFFMRTATGLTGETPKLMQ
ncbi:MAG: FAD-dependent monooxygenase [Pikeienuella sp.]